MKRKLNARVRGRVGEMRVKDTEFPLEGICPRS